ncbi:hypothetical protein [bacterium endosymbiont of Bathymodiolus sp. 5 South]|uniref:hypothetical protein n=1 Tax=bacterium endosymbiont of Bathymodiolus sp. 5 South TaxID=1181670 RepID=UPI00111A7EA1|nr:hypothetical protein [bacterium endosymbiont of Bathymodiolus sp. 5 South]
MLLITTTDVVHKLYNNKQSNASTLLKNRVDNCKTHSRCHAYRHCESCNKIRQAKLANTAVLSSAATKSISSLKNNEGTTSYLVAMPEWRGKPQANKLKQLKSGFTRILNSSANGAIVGVETSADKQLHLNAVINSKNKLLVSPFEAVARRVGVQISLNIQELATTTDIRRATAYSFKFERIPDKQEYSGNLYNLSGTTKRVGAVLSSSGCFKKSPILAMTSAINTLNSWGVTTPSMILMQSQELKQVVRKLCSAIAQLLEFNACYVGVDLLDKQQFIDYYNSEIVQLLTSNKSSPVCSDDSKNLSKQDFVNACKLLVGWGLEPPTLKIVSSQEFVKFKDSLVTMIHELNSNGYCSSRKRGRLSLEQFKIVYFEKMQALKKSLRANRLNEFKAYLKKLIISIRDTTIKELLANDELLISNTESIVQPLQLKCRSPPAGDTASKKNKQIKR